MCVLSLCADPSPGTPTSIGALVHPDDRTGLQVLQQELQQHADSQPCAITSRSPSYDGTSNNILDIHLQQYQLPGNSSNCTTSVTEYDCNSRSSNIVDNYITSSRNRSRNIFKYKIIKERNNGTFKSILEKFEILYEQGVRYFFMSQTYGVSKQLNNYINESNSYNDIRIFSPTSVIDGIDSSLKNSQKLLLEILVDGCSYQNILPIIIQRDLWLLPIIKNIATVNKKTLLPPIIIFPNRTLQQYTNEINEMYDNEQGNLAMLLSLGTQLQEFMLLKNIFKLNRATFLVHSHPYDLDILLNNDIAKRSAAKLSIFSAIFGSSGVSTTTANDFRETHVHLLSLKTMQVEAARMLLHYIQHKHRGDAYRNIVKHFQNNGFIKERRNSMKFGVKNKLFAFRLIMLPLEMSSLQYASGNTWFVESESTIKLNSNDSDALTYEKKDVPHYFITVNKIYSSCKNSSRLIESPNILTGNREVTRVASDIKYLILPELYRTQIYFKCNNNETKSTSVKCSPSKEVTHILICKHLKPIKNMTVKYRHKRSYYVNSINQQLLSPKKNYRFRKQYYGVDKRLHKRRNFPPEFSQRVRVRNFIETIPELFNCVGSTVGCLFCYMLVFYIEVDIGVGACMGACGVAVGGTCSVVLGRGVQRMSQQTVICTELYRQGLMPGFSYLADANYGNKLNRTNPEAMQVYRSLAGPVVALMRRSERFTAVVSVFATPWREHMEYSEGLREEDNLAGRIFMSIMIKIFTFFWYLNILLGYCSTLIIVLVLSFLLKMISNKL